MQNFKCPTMLYLFILVKKQIPTKNIHKISRIIFTITVEIITCMVKSYIQVFWLVLTYDLLEDRHMDDFIINIIFLFYYLKQWISCCPRSDRNRLQNMQKCGKNIHSLAHTAAPHVPFFVLPTFWHYPCSINEGTILNRPFYSYVLICQAFDLEWGWSWPCCDRDQYLVCIITKSFTFEKQQGLFHH